MQNVISHHAAYAFYPLATFGYHRGLELSPTITPAGTALRKYRDRGWIINCLRTENCYYPSKIRWPSDAHAWVIPSPPPGPAPGRPDPICANSFILKGVNGSPHSIDSGHLTHAMLRLEYSVGDPLMLREVERAMDPHWNTNRKWLLELSQAEQRKRWIW